MAATLHDADIPRSDPVLTELTRALEAGELPREALKAADADMARQFADGVPVTRLVPLRAAAIDTLLQHLWSAHTDGHCDDVALVAVGGYGRGELHPASDVDILILRPEDLQAGWEDCMSGFVTALWDTGLEIGHSVRTIAECVDAAKDDLTVATTLIETRLLAGPDDLLAMMSAAVAPDQIWPSREFFEGKRREQLERHHRYHDTGYNLEPNVKGSPGGLRDIQMINWVAKRHFGTRTLDELVEHRYLTRGQLKLLKDGQAYLWKVRFALHLLTGRQEDRLLFDYQVKLASMLGYEDASYTLAVEQMMQRYYRTVMDLSRINEMLLQLFEEAILMDPDATPLALNSRFQVKNGYLQTTNDSVFQNHHSALLELFVLLQQHPDIKGVSAYTIGLIKRNLHLIDENFRQDPRNHRLFLEIIKASDGVTHQLRRMNTYGVLGLYIPAFGRIVGRMQYDLFHAYTVDEHTLFVVSNLRRFALSRFDHEVPHCSEIMQAQDKPEIVYLAGLFHDIAKGRGGDHSKLGALDAEAFCLEHGLSAADAETVSWLVFNHLLLSTTAQKKDIGDPDVINAFAEVVGTRTRLEYLYLLTIADIRGTNPKLWNSWKASLFRELFESTARVLQTDDDMDRETMVIESRDVARAELLERGLSEAEIDAVWSMMSDDYFLKYRDEEIVWHTEWLAGETTDGTAELFKLRRQASGEGVEVAFYTDQRKHTFAHATALLDELGTTIVDARIVPFDNGFSLDTFVFLELDSRTEIDDARLARLSKAMRSVIEAQDDQVRKVTRERSRRARMFTTPTAVNFDKYSLPDKTAMELIAADRPGLLSKVGQVLMEQDIDIETAKIMTIGERAEDVFYIRNEDGTPLSEEQKSQLSAALLRAIDS